jgi:hypothetical protein
MNNQEAKFILGAYRPDGRDASDPAFLAALAQAERDPQLRAWFEAQRRFDTAMVEKLQTIGPPRGLREAILAGGQASAAPAKRRWRISPGWLAAAAAIVLGATLVTTTRKSSTGPTSADLASFALRDLADDHAQHAGDPPELAAVRAQLAGTSLPLTRNLDLNLDELTKNNCRVTTLQGRPVFEVCFEREGIRYHVYVGRRRDFAPGPFDPKAMNVRGEFASTTWADATHVYALVTQAGAPALQRVI